jgi:hypothetical protein
MPRHYGEMNSKKGNGKKMNPKPKEEKPKGKGLTEKQRKNLPPQLQKAILAKRGM